MGNIDDFAHRTAPRRRPLQHRRGSIRKRVRACLPRVDHEGPHVARTHRRPARRRGGEGRRLVSRVHGRSCHAPRTRARVGWPKLEHMNSSPRSASWKWWACGLLLCASAINYMDRQTLTNAAVRITHQFQLSQEQYGNLELGFGWALAVGSLLFGFLADRFPVRWVYPAALLLWSAMGFA